MAETNIAIEVARIEAAKATLKSKGVELGISLPTDKLDEIVAKFDTDLVNRGGIAATVKEGESVTIPKGYHDGSGTVAGVGGGGDYTLQPKTITPTKSQQTVVSDEGYYGLDAVTVKPIPEAYQDVSATTAEAADVLASKVFTAASGAKTVGTMRNNEAQDVVLSVTTPSYTIPTGKHSGSGTVSIVPETKIVTPTPSAQSITPTVGKVLSAVTVNPIPAEYKSTVNADVVASDILVGKTAVNSSGDVEGTMPDNGEIARSINVLEEVSVQIPLGYTSGGSVSVTDDLVNRLSLI